MFKVQFRFLDTCKDIKSSHLFRWTDITGPVSGPNACKRLKSAEIAEGHCMVLLNRVRRVEHRIIYVAE